MALSNPARNLAYNPTVKIPGYEIKGLKLDIGCGEKKMKSDQGFIGLDIVDLGQEIVWNVDQGIPLPSNSCTNIFMHHVLEHLENPLFVLNECWRVLDKEGEIEIVVPYHKESGAYVLHHTHFFSKKTFEHLEIRDINHRYGIRPWIVKELTVGDEKWIDDYGEPTIHVILSPKAI